MWKTIGEASEESKENLTKKRRCKERKGFGFTHSKGKAGPGNTSIRRHFADERFTEAVLDFLKCTSVGMVKGGVICRET